MNEEFYGQLAMVHPELRDDPARRMGQIAEITTPLAGVDQVWLRFEDDQKALYGMDAVLVFKAPYEIYDHLESEAMTLPKKDFRELRNIGMLLEYGSEKEARTAMEIVQRNPALLLSALLTLEDKLGIDYTPNRGRRN